MSVTPQPLVRSLCVLLSLATLTACDGEMESNPPDDDGGARVVSPDLGQATLSDQGVATPLEDMSDAGDIAQPTDMNDDSDQSPSDAPDMRDMSLADLGGVEDMSRDAGMEDMGEPNPWAGRTSLLVAQGRFGRTAVSCDGGLSWYGERDMVKDGHALYCGKAQPNIRCGPDEMCEWSRDRSTCEVRKCGCDHLPGSAVGITWTNGYFVANFGHGAPNTILRSADGVSWEDVSVLETNRSFDDVAASATRFVLAGGRYSDDQGKTWDEPAQRLRPFNQAGEEHGNFREIDYLDYQGGRFFMGGDGGALLSKDAGLTWGPVTGWLDECTSRYRGGVYGNGVFIITPNQKVDDDSTLCVSTDGAETFQKVSITGRNISQAPLFVDGVFYLWVTGAKVVYTSTDGVGWTARDVVGLSHRDGGAKVYDHGSGVFVSVVGEYEEQRVFRSVDGVTWTKHEDTNLLKSHRIKALSQGWAPEGFVCPTK